MQPIPLEYRPPEKAQTFNSRLLRFLLLGPTTDIACAFVGTCVALVYWLANGQPDFYFRGWSGVQVQFFVDFVGGAIIGLVYGLVLLFIERLTHRRMRPLVGLCVLVPVEIAFSIAITGIEFARRTLDVGVIAFVLSVVIRLAIPILTSRRRA